MNLSGPARPGIQGFIHAPAARMAIRLAPAVLLASMVAASAMAQATPRSPRSTPAAVGAAIDPRVGEGERALARGDAAEALRLADAAVAARPANHAARLLAARAHVERGELEPAWLQLDAVLAAAPRNVDALALMGLVSGQLAAAAFERLATEAPSSAQARLLQAETFAAQDRRTDAETAYEAALTLDPNMLEALLALGKLKRIRLACDEAIPLYERAEKIRPTFDGAYGLGFCLGYLQEDDKAVAQYERAVKRDPTAAVAWQGLGASLVKTGRAVDGIAALKRALAIEPTMSDGWYMLGMAYQSAGDATRSKEAFAKAEQLRTGSKP